VQRDFLWTSTSSMRLWKKTRSYQRLISTSKRQEVLANRKTRTLFKRSCAVSIQKESNISIAPIIWLYSAASVSVCIILMTLASLWTFMRFREWGNSKRRTFKRMWTRLANAISSEFAGLTGRTKVFVFENDICLFIIYILSL